MVILNGQYNSIKMFDAFQDWNQFFFKASGHLFYDHINKEFFLGLIWCFYICFKIPLSNKSFGNLKEDLTLL